MSEGPERDELLDRIRQQMADQRRRQQEFENLLSRLHEATIEWAWEEHDAGFPANPENPVSD